MYLIEQTLQQNIWLAHVHAQLFDGPSDPDIYASYAKSRISVVAL